MYSGYYGWSPCKPLQRKKYKNSIPQHVLNPSALAFGDSMGPDSMYYRHAHKYQRIMYKYVQDIGTPTVSRGLPKMQPQCTALLFISPTESESVTDLAYRQCAQTTRALCLMCSTPSNVMGPTGRVVLGKRMCLPTHTKQRLQGAYRAQRQESRPGSPHV